MNEVHQFHQSLIRADHNDCKALGTLHYRVHAISFKEFAASDWIDERTQSTYERYWCAYLEEQHPDERTWKVEHRDEVVGTVSAIPLMRSSDAFRPKTLEHIPEDKIACLRLMYVEPELQGQGIGRALMRQVLGFMRSNQFQAGSLITHATNENARGFYERAGWLLDEIFIAQVSEFFPEPDEMRIRARYYTRLNNHDED